MKKTNILFIIWGILVIGIMACLTALGFMLDKINISYGKLEEEFKETAIKYIEDNSLYPEESREIKITKSELIENEYLEELKVKDDVCDGYVMVKLEDGFKYNAYIKCKKYTTEGYKK